MYKPFDGAASEQLLFTKLKAMRMLSVWQLELQFKSCVSLCNQSRNPCESGKTQPLQKIQ